MPASDLTKKPDMRTTMELGAVLPLTAEVKDDHLYVGGVDMVELAREQGTALYVMDEADMRARMEAYLTAFRSRYPNSDIAFASKAFLNKEAARIVADEGLCLDVSGGGELAIALAAGFPTERIFMHGNNKTPLELREAIQAGVGRIVIDSRIELARISEIAGELGVEQAIYMRITPGVEADTHQYIRTGCEDSKFGFTMRDDFAYGCVKDVLAAPNVRLAGLHCHIGSQIFDIDPFCHAAEVMLGFAQQVRAELGYTIEELNLGGGFGIRYVAQDDPKALESYMEAVSKVVLGFCETNSFPVPFICIEPGRSIVGDTGITLYTIGSVKTIPGYRTYVSIDGGMTDNPRYALYQSAYEAVVANKAAQQKDFTATIAGRCCESGDLIQENTQLQTPAVGDILAVLSTGAYNYSMASNYNRVPRLPVVMVRGGEDSLAVRRETYEDLVRNDV